MATTKFNPKARAEEIARQLKEAEEAKQAYDAAIDKAVKDAGRTRAEFVEMLYDYFGIEAERTERRDQDGNVVKTKKGNVVTVETDKDESKRIATLAEKFEEMVEVYEASRQPKPHAA